MSVDVEQNKCVIGFAVDVVENKCDTGQGTREMGDGRCRLSIQGANSGRLSAVS